MDGLNSCKPARIAMLCSMTLTKHRPPAHRAAVVIKGYYASSFDTDGSVNGTTICPQGSYCPGGNQTQVTSGRRLAQAISSGIIPCPNGQWTKMLGASAVEECREFQLLHMWADGSFVLAQPTRQCHFRS
jgi:hypothetical protein